ncbi:MAG: hypothetical protein CMJ18_25480 [Phycisphaeraceae bacterium]|nr:hypothetical protein [Phycisphaeraceae bacterium]
MNPVGSSFAHATPAPVLQHPQFAEKADEDRKSAKPAVGGRAQTARESKHEASADDKGVGGQLDVAA